MTLPTIPSDYKTFLIDLKNLIHKAQQKAAISVNKELISPLLEDRKGHSR